MFFGVFNTYRCISLLIICIQVSLQRVSAQQQSNTSCTANFTRPFANITCNFGKDITKIRPIVITVELYPRYNMKPEEVLICTWTTETEDGCETKAGYERNGVGGHTLSLGIPAATADHSGQYACKLMEPDSLPPTPTLCRLKVPATITATVSPLDQGKENTPQPWITESSETTELSAQHKVDDARQGPIVIVLAVVGSMALVLLSLVVFLLHRRHKRKKNHAKENEPNDQKTYENDRLLHDGQKENPSTINGVPTFSEGAKRDRDFLQDSKQSSSKKQELQILEEKKLVKTQISNLKNQMANVSGAEKILTQKQEALNNSGHRDLGTLPLPAMPGTVTGKDQESPSTTVEAEAAPAEPYQHIDRSSERSSSERGDSPEFCSQREADNDQPETFKFTDKNDDEIVRPVLEKVARFKGTKLCGNVKNSIDEQTL